MLTAISVFNSSPVLVNILLLACETITLKRVLNYLNYTAGGALWKWLSENIVLICECRHELTPYASFMVPKSHSKLLMQTGKNGQKFSSLTFLQFVCLSLLLSGEAVTSSLFMLLGCLFEYFRIQLFFVFFLLNKDTLKQKKYFVYVSGPFF